MADSIGLITSHGWSQHGPDCCCQRCIGFLPGNASGEKFEAGNTVRLRHGLYASPLLREDDRAEVTEIVDVVRLAGERAGIEWPVGLHTFRHSCASIMFRRGVPKEAIRRLLGHHSWEFTAGTYVHLDDDDLPDGAVVGDLLADGSAEPPRAVVQQR